MSEEQELVTWASSQIKKAKNDRASQERQWHFNAAFYRGQQWVSWIASPVATETSQLVTPTKKPWHVRMTINKIRAYALKELAKLNQERPRGYVQPSTSDDTDIAAARAAESVLEFIQDKIHMESQMMTADFYSVIYGTSFLKDYWDESFISMDTEDPGEVVVKAFSPWHIFVPDLDVIDIDDQEWIAHASTMSPLDVARRYGVELPPDTKGYSDPLDDRFLSGMGIRQNTAKTQVTVYEMWTHGNKYLPDGGFFTWSQDKILAQGGPDSLPYQGQYPFSVRRHRPTGGFYGESTVTDLIPPQMQYNRLWSQLVEIINRISIGQYMAPRGTLDVRKWTNEPGLVVEYEPSFGPPTPIQTPNIPSILYNMIEKAEMEMSDIASQHDVSKGDAPGRVDSATGIGILQEADDLILSSAVINREEVVRRLGVHILSYVKKYWTAPRTIQVVGQNEIFESYLFSTQELRGQTNYQVVRGSSMPLSRAAKQATIMDLMNKGYISPAEGLKYLQLGDAARLWEDMQVDTRQAERENVKMANGEEVPVNDFDDDVVHIREHDDYRKRQEYDSLDPKIKGRIRVHTFLHLMQLAHKRGLLDMATIPVNPQALMAGQVDTALESQLRMHYESVIMQMSAMQPAPQGGM